MHQQVERVLFSHPGCPVYVALSPCWQDVVYAYNDLALQLATLGRPVHEHHGHSNHDREPAYDNPSGHFPAATPPAVTQPSYRYREAIVPSYRYGNFSHNVVPPFSKTNPSPSEFQSAGMENQIERQVTRREVEHGRVGAVIPRRLD
jgi:hypothetical protein